MSLFQTGAQILSVLTGTERFGVDNGGALVAVTNTQALALSSSAPAVNSNTAVASTTLTAANLLGSFDTVYLNMTGALTGAANATLPTVAALAAAMPTGAVAAGQGYTFEVINSSSGAFAWTVVTNTGWTLVGTMSVAQNTSRTFALIFTSPTTATLTSVGTGTYS
jgi:hypothetical protein